MSNQRLISSEEKYDAGSSRRRSKLPDETSQPRNPPTLFQGLMQLAKSNWLQNWSKAGKDPHELWCNIRTIHQFHYAMQLLSISEDEENMIFSDYYIERDWASYGVQMIHEAVHIPNNQSPTQYLIDTKQWMFKIENITWPPGTTFDPNYMNLFGYTISKFLYQQFRDFPTGWMVYDVVMPKVWNSKETGASVLFVTNGRERKVCKFRGKEPSNVDMFKAAKELKMAKIAEKIGLNPSVDHHMYRHKSNPEKVMLAMNALDMQLAHFLHILNQNDEMKQAFESAILNALNAILTRMAENHFIHGDLHAGNIMIRVLPVENVNLTRHSGSRQADKWSLDVCLIDFGRSTCGQDNEVDQAIYKDILVHYDSGLVDIDEDISELNAREQKRMKMKSVSIARQQVERMYAKSVLGKTDHCFDIDFIPTQHPIRISFLLYGAKRNVSSQNRYLGTNSRQKT